jgi:hypothetical protein
MRSNITSYQAIVKQNNVGRGSNGECVWRWMVRPDELGNEHKRTSVNSTSDDQ